MIATAMPEHLPGVLHSLEPTLDQFGYLAVVGLVLIEDFGVPVPGETVLILAAVYAGTGRLNIVLVALLGFCGAVIGDNIGFAIGHFGGRPLVERYGRYIFLTPARLDKATGFFDRHGGKIIIVARFIEGLRQANGIIAGISGMHWARFLLFNAIGAALWVASGRALATSLAATSTRSTTPPRATPRTSRRRGRAADRSHRPARGANSPRPEAEHQLKHSGIAARAHQPNQTHRSARLRGPVLQKESEVHESNDMSTVGRSLRLLTRGEHRG